MRNACMAYAVRLHLMMIAIPDKSNGPVHLPSRYHVVNDRVTRHSQLRPGLPGTKDSKPSEKKLKTYSCAKAEQSW